MSALPLHPLELARADGGGEAGELTARVVCGVNGSEAGQVAARLAARLVQPADELVFVSVHDRRSAPDGREAGPELAADLACPRRIESAARQVETVVLEGDPLTCLLAELERRRATLAVVGSHGQSRAVGIALGSVATHVLHEAPCPVLVARPPRAGSWPRSIAAAVDGSVTSAEAAAVARRLADRVGAELRFVVAAREPFVDLDAARRIAPELEELAGPVVHELHVLSEDVDLLVVGSRGLRGLRALGSVSERVAHEARCSVLAVRAPGDRRRKRPL